MSSVSENWKRPGELAGSGPRETRLAPGGVALTILSFLMFAGGIAIYVFLSRQLARESAERAALDAGSIEVQATITRHWRADDKDHTPMIAYQFEHQGHLYHGTSSTPDKRWENLDVGSPISIRFVPDRPEVSHPSDWQVEVMPRWMPAGMGALLAVFGLLPRLLIRRQRGLLRDGRAAPARVTGHRRIKQGYALLYEFALPEGGTRKGRGGQTRHPPEVGSVITILYDPENPKRNAPYPLEMVRLVQ